MERNRINITFYGNSLKLLEYYLGDNVKKHSFMNNFVVTAAFILFDCLKLNEEEINVLANIIKSSDDMKIVKKYAKILLKQILSKKKEKRKEERRRRKRKKVSEVKSITVERKETITVTSSISSTSNVEVSNSENENLPDFMKDNPWINIIRSRTRNQ